MQGFFFNANLTYYYCINLNIKGYIYVSVCDEILNQTEQII